MSRFGSSSRRRRHFVFHSKDADTWVDAHYLSAHRSLLRRWRPCAVCVAARLPLCTTVGRYGEYLSSQHLDLDSTDQNNSPRWLPSCCIAAKHKPHARFLVLCCTSSSLPNNDTSLFFFFLHFFHTLMAQPGCIWCTIAIICNWK